METKKAALVPLTLREKQITRLISEGYETLQVAAILRISPKTVETHKANIYVKLNVRNSAQLVRWYFIVVIGVSEQTLNEKEVI